MQTLIQAVDTQLEKYDPRRLSRRQHEDLHLCGNLAQILRAIQYNRGKRMVIVLEEVA